MVGRFVFTILILILAVQRIFELYLSRQNERWIRSQGGIEIGAGHFRVMQAIHILWFGSMLLEINALNRPFLLYWAIPAGIVFLLGQVLRYAAILTLQRRWTVRVFVLPGTAPVQKGIYRWIRHPNYLGVILEMAAFPLIGGAYLTAIVFSLANAALLWHRISTEEKALEAYCGYETSFKKQPRFLPFQIFRSIHH